MSVKTTPSLFTLIAMKYTLRDYQKQASDAAVKSFLKSEED
nr:MAG TPA: putative DNA repair helicase [Caudoviricetes sp.]